MVLSTLALVGIIQLIILLAGGIFFLYLHTRFLKKQIRSLRGGDNADAPSAPLPPSEAAMTEQTPEEPAEVSQAQAAGPVDLAPETTPPDPEKVTGEITELRKMLDEKLLLTANLRKLIEALEQQPDSAAEIAGQQTSSLLHLEEYIKLSRKEAAAVEEKITHYREQLAKAKKMLVRLKEQHEEDLQKINAAPQPAADTSGDAPKED